MKPIEAGRLRQAIDRARERLGSVATVDADQTRLVLEAQGDVRLIEPGEVCGALFDGQLVTIFVGSEALLTDLSLQDLQRRLPEGTVERVHRRALLNLDHVDRLKPQQSGGYLAVTRSGRELPISRQSARDLRKRLGIS